VSPRAGREGRAPPGTVVGILEGYYGDRLNDAHLKMAETPDGAELVGGEPLRFPRS